MLVDTDEVSLLNINVQNEELKSYADQMGIQEFPYIVLYINGDRDHNIHGPANEATATQILEELERVRPQAVTVQTAQTEPVSFDASDIPGETAEEHEDHPSPAEQLDVHAPQNDDRTRAPAGHETQPSQVGTVNVTPAFEQSGEPVDIKAKVVGDWIHESPRHEEGYIEEVGQDDVLADDVWARQIKTALPVISYDVYPEPRDVVNPIVEEPEPEPVYIERVAPMIVERPAPIIFDFEERRAPVIIEERRPNIRFESGPELIVPSQPFVPPHLWASSRPEVIREPLVLREQSPWTKVSSDKKN